MITGKEGVQQPAAGGDRVAPLPWHAMSVEDVAATLKSTPGDGLDDPEAAARLAECGENRLPEPVRRSPWLRFLLQFHNPLIYVLLVAGSITLLLGGLVDATVIFGVVLINAIIGHVQEGKAEHALEAVRSILAVRCMVIRDGRRRQLDATRLVPGDLVLLESGDKVPADLRLVHCKNLRVVEAAMTGESVPAEKSLAMLPEMADLADRSNMCYAGTLVSFGQAQGLVVATGARTEIGRIGALVGDVQHLVTPLTRRLDQFARQITGFILGVACLTLLYGHFVVAMPLIDLFLALVGLAVAAIPEGMPAVVTIVLAIGTRAMARQRAIVRRLPAVETLGSVSVICSDKTGTLTRNEMTAVRLVLPGREVMVSGVGYAPEGGFHSDGNNLDPATAPDVQSLLLCGSLCNDAHIESHPEKGWQLVGDPTEGALVTLASKAGMDRLLTGQDWPRVDVIPFESERQFMVTLHHDHQGRHTLFLKGAPERVFALCPRQTDGQSLDRAYWEAGVARAGQAGERVLALARAEWTEGRAEIGIDDIGQRFELLGLVGIIDPPRDEAVAAVAECQAAGIRVKMVTGDHVVTAAAIGRQLGLSADRALTGEAIEQLDNDALSEAAQETDVFARASPEHKLRLIRALQSRGHLVAMTGDGVNDAPALKAADIGVAMGHKGTDAAREASDVVLIDDNFASIARAVKEGRIVYDNIKKSLMHMLPTNGGEAGVILLAIFAGLPLPVTAGQILWVNTVTSVTLALSLAFEPAEKGVMAHAPRLAGERLVTGAFAMRILYVILLMMMATFSIFYWELQRSNSLEMARTAAVNTIVMCEIFYLLNVRHFSQHAFRLETLRGNPVVLLVIGILLVLQLIFTYAPPMQQLFSSVPLDGISWLAILSAGLLLFLLVEFEKTVLRLRGVNRM